MKTFHLLLISPLILSQVQSKFSYGSWFKNFKQESEKTPSEPTPSEKTPSEQTPSEPTPSEPTPSEPTPSEPTPSQQTPEPESVECQPWQKKNANGDCICDKNACKAFQPSHECSAFTASGVCQCSNKKCAILNGGDQDGEGALPICDENTVDGTCVQCTEATQEVDCKDHQVCYHNICICSDEKCQGEESPLMQDRDYCRLEYSGTADCVECRIDDHCLQDYQECKDNGFCICRDELIVPANYNGFKVCSSEDQFGVPAQCRTDKDCPTGTCNDDFECQCSNEKCPQYTQCDLEGDVDGECNQPLECKDNDDCNEGQLCDVPSGLCYCDPMTCMALNDDLPQQLEMLSYQCYGPSVVDATGTPLSITLADGSTLNPQKFCAPACDDDPLVADFSERQECPEGRICHVTLDGDATSRCVQVEQVCRSQTGVILPDSCPPRMGCLNQGEGNTQPFCTSQCNAANNYCQGYLCGEGYSNVQEGEGLNTCIATQTIDEVTMAETWELLCGCTLE